MKKALKARLEKRQAELKRVQEYMDSLDLNENGRVFRYVMGRETEITNEINFLLDILKKP